MTFHAKENIVLPLFFRAEISSFSNIKISCKLRKCYGKIIFLPTYYVEKYFLLPQEIHNTNFSFILKFINPSFLLNMNLPFVQGSCFYSNFFHSFIETCLF